MAAFLNQNIVDENPPTILSRIAVADKSAVNECVDTYGGMIWTMAKKFTESNEDAKKAAQEIFSDIWQNAESGDLSLSDERLWIMLIARKRLKEYGMMNKFHKSASTPENIVNFH